MRIPYPIRDVEGGERFDLFIVSAVVTITATRLFLWSTGFPQVGGGKLHFAHLLWGGLAMLVSVCMGMLFLNRRSRTFAALVGGVGFGLFIDEVGKFVTADNDYFFAPVAAIIYAVLVGLYVLVRGFVQRQGFSRRELTVNAVELLKEAAAHDLDVRERQAALELLDRADQTDPIVAPLRQLLTVLPASPRKVSPVVRDARRLGRRLAALGDRPGVEAGILVAFAAFATYSVVVAVQEAALHAGIGTGVQLVAAASSAALLLTALGLRAGSDRRLLAFRLADWSLMINLLVAQFFHLLAVHFSGYVAVGLNVLLLVIARYYVHHHVVGAGRKAAVVEALGYRERGGAGARGHREGPRGPVGPVAAGAE